MKKSQIRNDGLVGLLVEPSSNKRLPGIILVGGSDGGIPPEFFAEQIARQGYVVFALAFFGEEDLPTFLENIPLEYFRNAFHWLKEKTNVLEDNIGLIGYSRGGELALLLGSTFPQLMKSIIVYVPSSEVCGGFPYPNKPAWIYNNNPISPFISSLMSKEPNFTEVDDLYYACKDKKIPFHANTAEDPYDIVDLFLARNANQSAPIAVENIQCPILIFSGDDDKIWPSATYCKNIMDRLDQCNSSIERKHICYPNTGHGLAAPYNDSIYHPVGKFWCRLGGAPEANEFASKASWNEVINFLKRTL